MGFGCDEVSGFAVEDVGCDFEDGSAEFVSDDAGGFDAIAGPVVPVVDVEIGSAE